jgi:peroxisomal membrane protein 4
VAGAIGGYFVWGRYSAVNYQIVLYLTSRVLVGLGKYLQQVYLPEEGAVSFDQSYPLFAAVVWGLVMILFEERPSVLHPSLKKSMDEIYRYSGTGKTRNVQRGHGPGTAAVEEQIHPRGHRMQDASSDEKKTHACEKSNCRGKGPFSIQ